MSNSKLILIIEESKLCDETSFILSGINDFSLVHEESSYDPDRVEVVFLCDLQKVMSRSFLSNYNNLKYIVSPTTGFNHIDYDYCSEKNIQILLLKDEKELLKTITATRDLAWGLILSIVRKIPFSFNTTLDIRNFDRTPFIGRDLDSLTIGIIGVGRLGKMMLDIANAFGMNVLVHDKYPDEGFFKNYNLENTALDILIPKSDIVSLHVNYSKENELFFGEKEFSMMKDNSFFINSARGELVDENAMLKALIKKNIYVAVDVVSKEHDNDNLMRDKLIDYAASNSNLIITPHIGGYTKESFIKTQIFMARRLAKILGDLDEL